MKCKYCGQEMIDIKDYCVNCGKKLKEDKQGITLGGLLLIFGIIILVTIFVCYMIMNYNRENDIKPYLNQEEKVEEKNDTKIEETPQVDLVPRYADDDGAKLED